MKTIAQRTLRNESGEILREAESGEQFVITVHGRPVALLGPYEARNWVPRRSILDLLATPTDPGWDQQLRERKAEDSVDPWPRDPWK